MTRIVEQDGKLILKSFSHFGPPEEADAALRRTVQHIEEHNRKVDAGQIDGKALYADQLAAEAEASMTDEEIELARFTPASQLAELLNRVLLTPLADPSAWLATLQQRKDANSPDVQAAIERIALVLFVRNGGLPREKERE